MISKLRDAWAEGLLFVYKNTLWVWVREGRSQPPTQLNYFTLPFEPKNIKHMTRRQEIYSEIDHLKQQLRERERERAIVKWLILVVNTYSLGSDNRGYYES